MRKLRKLRKLSWDERALLCRAAVLLIAAEIGLRLFPFRELVRWCQRGLGPIRAGVVLRPEQISWIVEAAARNLWFRPTCLRRSLVLCALLRRRGWPARLVIGATTLHSEFQAHAWVMLDEKRLGPGHPADYQDLISFHHPAAGAELA